MPHDSTRLAVLEKLYYCSQENGSLEEQLRCINEFVDEAHRQKSRIEAFALAQRATLYYNNDMNDSILIAIPRDMERVEAIGILHHYYEMWSLVAYTYIYMKHNKQGLIQTQKMYEHAKKHKDMFGMGMSRCIMGTAYANLRNYDQSIESFQKSIEILSSIHPTSSFLPDAYTYYGNALNEMKDYQRLDSLTRHWNEFLTAYTKEHNLNDNPLDNMYWGYYYLACAQADLGLNRNDRAAQQLKKALKYIGSTDNYQGMNWLYLMAQLSLRRGSLNEALDFNDKRMALINSSGEDSDLISVMKQRAEIMQAFRRYDEAARLYREICTLSDSLNAQDVKEQLNEMSTLHGLDEEKMANERLQMNNERLQMQNERNQFRFIIIVVSVAVLSLAVFLFFRIRSARRLKQAHSKLQTAYSDLKAANEVIEQTTAAKERIESELRIARDIQMSMVTNQFPERDDMDIFASMSPAKEVGGDLYNILLITDDDRGDGDEAADGSDVTADAEAQTEGGKLYFALGDVSGKGVPASLFMAQATRLFRTLAKQQLPPAEIATRMNEELGEDNEQGMFVTMFLGLVDLATGHLDFCNAGHNPPVVMDAGKAEANPRFLEMEPNAPIGLWPGLEYVGEEIADIRQQPLFIYTDGLNEAENREQEQFGDDRLLELLAGRPFLGSRETLEMLKDEVEKHRDGAEPNDDLTMMCIMIKDNNAKNITI